MTQRRLLTAVVLAVAAAALHAQVQQQAPVPGRNVNMVSGDKWPDGDPYLQRQNEPSLAASTRNPLHLLGGSNDYRTVDLPVPVGTHEDGDKVETGDAWLGLYKSLDGGQRWKSTLLPGYPQDTSDAGRATPMYGYQAGADPVVRPGAAGLFYYAGLVFDRTGDPVTGAKKSRIFVSRFIDNNNKEAGDPIQFLGATAVASDSGETGAFLDKPWMAVDIPRPGAATCTILSPDGTPQQSIKAGAVYVTYTIIQGIEPNVTGTIMFTRSIDCGQTWSAPIALSRATDPVNQGTTIAIDPVTGTVYVAWRQFGLSDTETDSIVVVKSAGGGGFERPRTLRQFYPRRSLGELMKFLVGKRRTVTSTEPAPVSSGDVQSFDQKTALDAFRTNTYPTMAIDGTGRVYVAWTERGRRSYPANTFDSTIVMSTSRDGATWTAANPVETHAQPGHQIMPSLAFGGGKLMLVYYDLREDIADVFGFGVKEGEVQLKRHTVDLRAAQALPADVPDFGQSVQVSQYIVGSRPGSTTIEQLQFNPPNLPLFQLGHVPFMGDYVDVAAAPAMVQDAAGNWQFNTAATSAPVFHAAWTDNRDVKPPTNGDWTAYTPPTGDAMGSVFDPTQQRAPCSVGNAGMRNQNVYTSRITAGLVAGSPGNSKPLDPNLPRSFVVFAQNTTSVQKYFRMTIAAQPIGGRASFAANITDPLVTVIDVTAPARSTVSRTVVVTSTDTDAKVTVDITEIGQDGGSVPAPLSSVVILNPDISNPDISNPDISNPDISNPDISNAEVYNPDISNPDISNPDISNPDISNPDISNPDISNVVILNPDISNPDISNPDISNPDISNPDISNPDISNPDISNGSLTDTTWTITNTGNTTANYTIDVLGNVPVPEGIKVQIIVYKTYKTPVSDGCTLKYTTHTVLVSNTVDPSELPSIFLEPGGEGKITLRIVDPDPTDDITLNPVDPLTPIAPTVESTTVNSEDVGDPAPEPPSATPPSTSSTSLAVAPVTIADVGVSEAIGPLTVQVSQTTDGNTVAVAGATVVAAIVVNPGGGTLAGTTVAVTNSDGFALFNNLSIDRPGSGYRLSFTASVAGVLPILSAPFNVTLADVDPAQNVFIVTTTADSGIGSLRQAVINANSTANGVAGPDVIAFGLRGTGPWKIALQTPLPALVDPVVVDGTSQSGYDAGVGPLVEVSGATIGAGGSFYGFDFGPPAAPSTIRGLSITGFGTATGLDTRAAIHTIAGELNVRGNWIGIAPDKTIVGNQTGIIVDGGSSDIGGTNGAATRNVIGGGRTGVLIRGGNNTRLRGNYIGTTPDGLFAASHLSHGISIFNGVTNTLIGGPHVPGGLFAADSPANVISGNGGMGISLQDTAVGLAPTNTMILGNVIGLNVAGTDLGNAAHGILVRNAPGTIVGLPGAGNVISGSGTPGASASSGIQVTPGVSPQLGPIPVIQSNIIGLDISGVNPVANALEGITLFAPAIIGGNALAGEGNLIAGNGTVGAGSGAGIDVIRTSATISGNVIGLNSVGLAVPNGFSGVTVAGGSNVTIGGTAAGLGNVISGNGHRGIQINPSGPNIATNILIQGNRIGTNAAGAIAGVGNGGSGIFAVGTNITIGGTDEGAGNVIAGNGIFAAANPKGGVSVVNIGAVNSQATIRGNTIFSNAGLGIELLGTSNGSNDHGDGDNGPNGLLNRPEILAAVNPNLNTGYLSLKFDSAPGAYAIEVFSNSSCDPSGFGEGQTLLFTTQVTIGAENPVRTIVETGALSANMILTATATDAAGNTSEFSNCATVATTNARYWSPAAGGNGHFYEFVNVSTPSWNTANANAMSSALLGRPGHLVTMASAAEHAFAVSLSDGGDIRAWIGLTDPTGTNKYGWVTGEPLTYTAWADGEPNNHDTERWTELINFGANFNNVPETFFANQGYIVEYGADVEVGVAVDTIGDAQSYNNGAGVVAGPDLSSVTVRRRGSDLVFEVRFASGFDPSTTFVNVMLDLDKNPATGHAGISGGCSIDTATIGSEYFVQAFPQAATPGGSVLQYAGTCNQFQFRGSVAVETIAGAGYDIIVPLAQIGNDGALAYKVLTFARLSPTTTTGILDVMTNVGTAAPTTSGGN